MKTENLFKGFNNKQDGYILLDRKVTTKGDNQ